MTTTAGVMPLAGASVYIKTRDYWGWATVKTPLANGNLYVTIKDRPAYVWVHHRDWETER